MFYRRILVRSEEGGLAVQNRPLSPRPGPRYGPRAILYPRPREYPSRLVIVVGRTERTYMDNGRGHRLVSSRPAR